MSDRPADTSVLCRFDGCASTVVVRTVLAVVDQVAAAVDADIAVLEALDYPLTDGIEALFVRGVSEVEIRESSGVISIDIHLEQPTDDVGEAFADARDAVETFFDVTFPESAVVRLAGVLR